MLILPHRTSGGLGMAGTVKTTRSAANAWDRALNIVAPGLALRNVQNRARFNMLSRLAVVNSGYGNGGASRSKKSLMGWLFKGGSPDDDIGANNQTLRERSRDLYMNTPLATGAIKTTRTKVVGSGLYPKAVPDTEVLQISLDEANKWARHTERRFALWAESVDCDVSREFNFYERMQLAELSWLMSGDVFVLLPLIPRAGCPYDLRIGVIEADRVCTPGQTVFGGLSLQQVKKLDSGGFITEGVEVAPDGEVVAFHVARRHPLSASLIAEPLEWDRVVVYGQLTGRRNILHLWDAERPEQRRGVPILAPVIEDLKQIGRYSEAELGAAVVNAFSALVIESETPEGIIGESGIAESEKVTDERETIEMGPMSVLGLLPDEKAKIVEAVRPNVNFDGFVKAMCQQIGSALEIPLEVLLKMFNSSYSASRGALMEMWQMVRMRRTWLANGYCQPIYEEWLTEAILRGHIAAPGFFDDPLIRKAWCRTQWNGPAPIQLNPVQEANAAEIRVRNRFSTRAQETAELNGGDFEQNATIAVEEEKLMAAAAPKQEKPPVTNPLPQPWEKL